MGGMTSKLYKDLLMKELFGNDYAQMLKNGNIPPIDDKKIEKAIQEVWKKVDAVSPNLKDPKKHFKSQTAKERDPQLFQQLGYDEASQQKFGSGNTVEQYKQNRENLMKYAVVPDMKRQLEWSKAMKRLSLTQEQRTAFDTHSHRWARLLMKTGGGKENLVYNAEVAALIVLCSGDMTPEQFKSVRMNHYMDEFVNGKIGSLEEARQKVDAEVQNAPERLLGIIKQEMQKGRDIAGSMPNIACDVMRGTTENKRTGHTTKGCFEAVGNSAINLAWVAGDIQLMLQRYGLPDEKNLTAAEVMDGQTIGGMGSVQEIAEMAANPYFLYYDPFKTYEVNNGAGLAPAAGETTAALLKNAYLSEQAQFVFAISEAAQPNLGKYVIHPVDEVNEARVGDLHVFRTRDLHGGHRTSIQRIHKLEGNQLLKMEEAQPELLVNTGLTKETNALVQKIGKWDKEKRTSDQFERMRRALLAMEGKTLPENAQAAHYEDMQATLQELLDKTNEYLAKKTAEKAARGRFRNGYEKERVEFAEQVKKYAEKKLEQVGYAREAFDTIEMSKAAEREFANTPERLTDPRYIGRSALVYKLKKEEEAAAARAAERIRAEEDAARRRHEEEKAQNTESGKGYRAKLDEIGKDIAAPRSNDQASASEKVTAFVADKKRGYDGAKNDPAAFEEATRKYLAAKTVERYLKMEREQEKDPKDWTMHELVNAGKINELTDFVMHSDIFQQRFPSVQKYKNEAKLQDVDTLKYCFQTAKHLNECLDLAKDAHQENENNRVQVNIRVLEEAANAEKAEKQGKDHKEIKTRKRSLSVDKRPKEKKDPMVPAAMGRRSMQPARSK